MLRINGAWTGWSGDTIVQLSNGSVWKQSEYYYSYRYAYRPTVELTSGKMLVKGMSRAVRVQRIA